MFRQTRRVKAGRTCTVLTSPQNRTYDMAFRIAAVPCCGDALP